MEDKEYTTQEILIELGYYRQIGPEQIEYVAPRNLIESVQEQLRQLRKTHTKHKSRASGEGEPYSTTLHARLIKGIHWRKFAGRILYSPIGREVILARIKPYSKERT